MYLPNDHGEQSGRVGREERERCEDAGDGEAVYDMVDEPKALMASSPPKSPPPPKQSRPIKNRLRRPFDAVYHS